MQTGKQLTTRMQYLWRKFSGFDFDDEEAENEGLLSQALEEIIAAE